MTQNWGSPPPGQQWAGQQAWNRPTAAWNPPPVGNPYPPAPPPPAFPGASFAPPAGGFSPPPGSFSPPPTKKKSPFLTVLLGGGFLVITAFFLIALVNYLNNGAEGGGSGRDPQYHQVENVPAPNYKAPALPVPEEVSQLDTWTKANALYNESVPVPTNCVVPQIDPTTASDAAMEQRLTTLSACLWGVWEGPVTEAGYQLPRPPVTVYAGKVTTACGSAENHNAFWCSADQRIYVASDVWEILPKSLRSKPFVADYVIAHEFGHHIQGRSGIFAATVITEGRVDKALANEYNRRLEVQADCFAGMWLNAIGSAAGLTNADRTNLMATAQSIGSPEPDPEDNHGTGKSRRSWITIGLDNASAGACNTYLAPSGQVS